MRVSLRFKHELDEDEVGEFVNGVLSPTTLQSGPDRGAMQGFVVCDLHSRFLGVRAWVS